MRVGEPTIPVLSPALRLVRWLDGGALRFAVLVGVVFGSQWALFRAEAAFTAVSGLPTPDTQNGLTVSDAVAQIGGYGPEPIRLYVLFAVVDFVFPLVAALMIAVVAHRAILISTRLPGRPVPEAVALLGLLPAVFDYVENVAFLFAVALGGALAPIRAALVAKAFKLGSLGLCAALVGSLVLLVIARLIRRWRNATGSR